MTNHLKNWSDAENFCQTKGGHLVSVTSKEVNDYLLSRVEHCGQRRVWIGATDQKSKESWENCPELYNTDEHQQGRNDLDCEASLNFVCSRTLCAGTV